MDGARESSAPVLLVFLHATSPNVASAAEFGAAIERPPVKGATGGVHSEGPDNDRAGRCATRQRPIKRDGETTGPREATSIKTRLQKGPALNLARAVQQRKSSLKLYQPRGAREDGGHRSLRNDESRDDGRSLASVFNEPPEGHFESRWSSATLERGTETVSPTVTGLTFVR